MVTRGGVTSWWDRVAGPSANRVENAGTFALAFLGGSLAPHLGSSRRLVPGRDGLADVVLRVLAVDLWGGAWCNNTPAAARWYHREGQGRSQHLAFAAAHLHPFVVACLDRPYTAFRSRLVWALSLYGYLQLATLLVTRRHRPTQRFAAVVATLGGVLLDRLLGSSPRAPWFASVYYVKLLTGHAGGAAALPIDPLGS